ncbi:MAG: Wzz/FepE/Etk N-terminal domain-containing protein, partial [Smithellaceae bacterium]|nr:Wzz/FepE/Etk N-terminal domain-containing protein [Smithellaceae bacterium]
MNRVQQEPEVASIKIFLTVLFKYKVLIISVFILIVAAVTAINFLVAPTYEAKSRLLVKYGREHGYSPEVGQNNAPLVQEPEDIVNSEIEILTNGNLLDDVINSLGAQNLYPENILETIIRQIPY